MNERQAVDASTIDLMTARTVTAALLLSVTAGLFVMAACLAWGGPTRPPSLPGIVETFRSIKLDGLPLPSTYSGSDGTARADRE